MIIGLDELDTTRSRCRSKEENSDNLLSACAFFMDKLGRRGMQLHGEMSGGQHYSRE